MKHQNQWELARKLTILVGLCIMTVMLFLLSQAAIVRADQPAPTATLEPNNKYFTTITKTLSNGKNVDEYMINGPPKPPAGYELERAAVELPKPNLEMGTNSLTVPAYDWVFGCSSVSGAMIAGYYDRNGFPNIYTGPTDGGVMPLDNSSWPLGRMGPQRIPTSVSRLPQWG